MQLTIDNLDGLGPLDYSASIDRSGTTPLRIERTLNAPSVAHGMLVLVASRLRVPVRRARVRLVSDAGTVLFTGYLATEPEAVYAGVATEGPVYRLGFSAVSDEWLLDKQTLGVRVGASLGAAGTLVVASLANRTDSGRLSTAALKGGRAVGVFNPVADAAWSVHAGSAAAAAYAGYRVLDGAVSMAPAGALVHTFSDGDGSLAIGALRTGAIRELANDITVSGELEPAAYWTEIFEGDGTTSVFDLNVDPAAASARHAVLVNDAFDQPSLDRHTWILTDPGSHLALAGTTAGHGLAFTGGNGFDGQTTLAAWDSIELGGTLVAEVADVSLTAGSTGVLAGFYQGSTAQANCLAGFNVRQTGGQTVVTPLLNGAESGTTFALLDGHRYTLRIRLHCPELLRVRQSFYAKVAGAVQQFGGGLVDAPLSLVFELRDTGASSNTPVTVLLDTTLNSSPAQSTFVAVNSLQLFGSLTAVRVTRTGSAWLRTTDTTTGTVSTRLVGHANEGVDATLSSFVTAKVTFLPGRVPAAGELVTVSYRGCRRAVARRADAASLATEAAGGAPGTARWLGKVVSPHARSSDDCDSAAEAILSFATDRAAAVTGSYVVANPAGDVWPGDTLALTQEADTLNVLARRIQIDEAGASPEVLTYRIAFANDWAEGLGLHLSEAIARDALLPTTALTSTAPTVLPNLQQLVVTAVTGSGTSAALTIDAGIAPPAGGGFEVRRRDGGFGAGTTASGSGDLVLRSPVRGFLIPRATFEESFFVRAYDASSPPLYSRESSVIVTHLPLG